MWSKLDIRKIINNTKNEYAVTKDKNTILKASILKGLYIAMGGEKGIALPNKYDKIVLYSKIIFKYKLKQDNITKAYDILYDDLMSIGKIPEYYLDDYIPNCNRDLAKLLATLVISGNNDDILINYNNIYNISMNILMEMER